MTKHTHTHTLKSRSGFRLEVFIAIDDPSPRYIRFRLDRGRLLVVRSCLTNDAENAVRSSGGTLHVQDITGNVTWQLKIQVTKFCDKISGLEENKRHVLGFFFYSAQYLNYKCSNCHFATLLFEFCQRYSSNRIVHKRMGRGENN